MSDPSSDHQDAPRLRVWHFFLFATACAVAVSVRNYWMEWEFIPEEVHTYARLHLVFSSLLYGIFIGCLCLLAWQRFAKQQTMELSPGQWLLFFAATCVLLDAASSLIAWLCEEKFAGISEYQAWQIWGILVSGSMSLSCWWFANKITGGLWWKWVLIFPGLVLTALAVMHAAALCNVWRPWFTLSHFYAQLVTTGVVGPTLSRAVYEDWENRAKYNWLHWVGVGTTLLFCIGGFVASLGWLYYYT